MKVQQPQFAYPQTVEKTARADYARAIKQGNDREALRALMNLTIARTLVSNDNAESALTQLKTFADSTRSPQIAALTNLVIATMYEQIYAQSSWKYNSRSYPLEPLSPDFTEWSGDQFRMVVNSYIDKALAHASHLKKAQIADYSTIIKSNELSRIYYPTLYDFAELTAIELYSAMKPGNGASFIPLSLIAPYSECAGVPLTYTSEYNRLILTHYGNLLDFHKGEIAAYINYDLQRLEYVKNAANSSGCYKYSDVNAAMLSALKSLFDDFRTSEYSCDILSDISSSDGDANIWLYDHCIDNIKKFPSFFNINKLHNIVARLSEQSVSVKYPDVVAIGGEMEIKCNTTNVNEFKLRLLKADVKAEDTHIYISTLLKRGQEVATKTINVAGNIPFTADTIVKIKIDEPGKYVVLPEFEGMNDDYSENSKRQVIVATVTNLISAKLNYKDKSILVLNGKDGSPMKGAKVKAYHGSSSPKEFGKTDSVGMVKATVNEYSTIIATKDGINSAPQSYSFYNYFSDNEVKEVSKINILTALSIYRPGDEIDWVVIASKSGLNKSVPCSDCPLTVTLRDANYQIVDTMAVVTDAFGRATGKFKIPEGSLTGYYTLRARGNASISDNISVMVSDYKLPTFTIETDKPLMDYPEKGDVTINGTVKTYSGFPLADATVKMELSVSRWRWLFFDSGSTSFYNAPDITTGADGSFSIVIPASLLKQSPIPKGVYSAQITATSQAGESHDTTVTFNIGSHQSIIMGDTRIYDVSSKTTLLIKVLNEKDEETTDTVRWTLLRAGSEVCHGSLSTANPTVDWRDVAGGTYTLRLTLDGNDCDEPLEITDIVIYRPTDNYSPSHDMLWTPSTRLSTEGKTAKILLGTNGKTASVLMTVWDNDNYCKSEWLTLPRGMRYITVKLPSDHHPYNVSFLSVANMKAETLQVTITPKPADQHITLKATSFRDKLTPGMDETWSFKVVDRDGLPVKAAVMLDMYNKALDQIYPHSWSLYIPKPYGFRFFAEINDLSGSTSQYCSGKSPKTLTTISILRPELLTWDYQFYQPQYRGRNVYYATSGKMMKANTAETADLGANMMMEYGASIEESVSLDEELAAAPVANDAEAKEEPKREYRPAEVTLAMFRPMLTTDADGTIRINFTVPNANSTWQLYALAYSEDMLVSSMAREILTSKPLMVQSNLPRFLRVGDDAILAATVMNNSDSQMDITTDVELFNPATGATILKKSFTNTLGAAESTVVSIPTGDIPEMAMIGYRIYASDGTFTDGEQSAIPVLSTITPVIETETFYSSPDERSISVKIPDVSDSDARLTLQYCENPLWTVVTALPGLRQSEPTTSPSAAESIYSAAIASWLIKKNPSIAVALKKFSESPSDSTLVSMLERNADLKTLLIQATPWMVDAMTDTERMQRLAILFDRNETDKVIRTATEVLAKSVCADGGLAWSQAMKRSFEQSSQWATLRTLMLLGELNYQGALPSNAKLEKVISGALKYMDKSVAADFAKYPNGDYIEYTYMRQLFPDIKQSTAAAKVSAATIQRIINDWTGFSQPLKAIGAIVLENAGYHTSALNLIESLRQYGIYNPRQGMTWQTIQSTNGSVYSTAQILDAFARVTPDSDDIDKIRQWLILQKEALNWGNSVATTASINSILTSSKRWVEPAHPAHFSIGGEEFTPDAKAAPFSGYLRTSLPVASSAGKELVISKGGDTMAYGALYAQYRAQMADIKAESCDAVSIDKRTWVKRDGKWMAADSLAVGDRVKVELLIKSTRDMDYVAITDQRAACLEPVEQLPQPLISEGIYFYRENLDAETRIFVNRLPRGTYRLEYELFVNNAGSFTTGIATIQSQYAPQLTAHSAGSLLKTF